MLRCRQRAFPMKYLLIFVGVLITHLIYAQELLTAKVSPILFHEIRSVKPTQPIGLSVTVKGDRIPVELNKRPYQIQTIFKSAEFSVYKLSATVADIDSILQVPEVVFIERGNRVPKEELVIGNLDLSVNKINLAHRNFPSINGDGIVVSVKENKPDTSDIDFKGRFLTTNLASTTVNSHASIMATMVGGGGNSWHLGRGAAWGSTISSSTFATLMPDANNSYQQYNISVQNHSYGVGIENYYGADAAAYDASTINNDSLLHVFSSGIPELPAPQQELIVV